MTCTFPKPLLKHRVYGFSIIKCNAKTKTRILDVSYVLVFEFGEINL